MWGRYPSSGGGERDEGIGDVPDGIVPPGAQPPNRPRSGTVQSLPKRRPHKGGIPPGHGIRNGVIAVLREESHDAGHGDELSGPAARDYWSSPVAVAKWHRWRLGYVPVRLSAVPKCSVRRR